MIGILESRKTKTNEVVETLGFNTFIGGVASTIPDAATLATKLNISESDISLFETQEDVVKAKIDVSYACPGQFEATVIKYFDDQAGNVTSAGDFNGAAYLEWANFPNCQSTSINFIRTLNGVDNPPIKRVLLENLKNATAYQFQVYEGYKLETIYIPKATQIGSTDQRDFVFNFINAGCKIYVHPALATNNSGAADGDLQYAISRGAEVIYVDDFTAASKVTNLSVGTFYATGLKLNFTTPTGIRPIEEYEVYVDGLFNSTHKAGGDVYALNLNPGTEYKITVYSRDQFYNRSLVSNEITVRTNTQPTTSTEGLLGYYKLDDNGTVVDSYAGLNGTNYGSTPQSAGKVGASYYLSGSGQYIKTGITTLNYLFADALNSYSLPIWFKPDNITSDGILIGHGGGTGSGGIFALYINSSKSLISVIRGAQTVIATNVSDEWHFCEIKWNGTKASVFYDGKVIPLKVGAAANQTTYGNAIHLGIVPNLSNGRYFKGYMDEFAAYNRARTYIESSESWNSGNGTTL